MSTVTLQVAASSDDARNVNGGGSKQTAAATQHIGKFSTTDYWNGFRFTAVAIPQGSTITSASLDLYSAEVTAGSTAKAIFYGAAEDNTATFDASSSYPEGKPRTTASVAKDFTVSSWSSTLGFGVEPVDVTSIVQEIIDRAGWSSGNALAIVCHDNGSANSNYIGHSTYDRDPARGAKLTIEYTTGGGASPQTITASAIASSAAVGTPGLETGAVSLAVDGITSAAALGLPTLTAGPATLAPSGINSVAALGQLAVTPGPVTIAPNGIAGNAAVGTPTLAPGSGTVTATGITSSAAVASPTLEAGAVVVAISGISSAAAVGSPQLSPSQYQLAPTGISSTASVGTPVLEAATVQLLPAAIPSSAAVGTPQLNTGMQVIVVESIPPAATVSEAALQPGAVNVSPVSIASNEAVSSPAIQGSYHLAPGTIVSDSEVGLPSLSAVVLIAPGVASHETVSPVSLIPGNVHIQLFSIPGSAVVSSVTVSPVRPRVGRFTVLPVGTRESRLRTGSDVSLLRDEGSQTILRARGL